MVAYRFYMLNTAGHINGCKVIDAVDDEEVRVKAEALKRQLEVPAYEVWDCDRRVVDSTEFWRSR